MSYIPEESHLYQGKQIIINSDRLTFNAKDDSILLFSKEAIGFSTKGSFHFDTSNKEGNKFIVNSPNIYFGLKDGNLPTEPVLLGNKTKDWMVGDNGLLDLLDSILDMIEGEIIYLTPTGPTSPFDINELAILDRKTKIDTLRTKFLENLSNQVKTI
tara:strand:+ start:2306 stop:2776 length:471 start_codon:yes stop_codon:yes gene_type:complete